MLKKGKIEKQMEENQEREGGNHLNFFFFLLFTFCILLKFVLPVKMEIRKKGKLKSGKHWGKWLCPPPRKIFLLRPYS